MLQELRQKPKHVREKYAFWGALGFTALIALVWGVALSSKFNTLDVVTKEEENDKALSGGAFSRSFYDAKNSMASAWEAFTTDTNATTSINDENSEVKAEVPATFNNNTATTSRASSSPTSTLTGNKRTILIATSSIITASSTE